MNMYYEHPEAVRFSYGFRFRIDYATVGGIAQYQDFWNSADLRDKLETFKKLELSLIGTSHVDKKLQNIFKEDSDFEETFYDFVYEAIDAFEKKLIAGG